jgi:6-phosphofructokinase 1
MVDLYENGIECVHAPKTMDLDLQTYSVGGDSTINRIASFVQDLKTTGRTHNRVMVTEVFGRYAGHTAFRGGIAAEADAILIPEIPVEWDIVYKHMFDTFTRRMRKSDNQAATYTVVVAEGLQNADGTELVDESAGTDAFGHKKLAGAGKYVRQQLEDRMGDDPKIKDFMKEMGLFVEGVYEAFEVREIVPEHLVRCGDSSAYDTNFGFEAGAAAVLLLLEGKSGVTVTGITGNQVSYIPAEKAIEPRHVDLDQVPLYEAAGITFGRKSGDFKPKFSEYQGQVDRIY